MSDTERHRHWETIYSTRGDDEVSWFEPTPASCLPSIERCGLAAGSRVIDVGAGASRLVDSLLARGLRPTVLDISEAALERSRRRLGSLANQVQWVASDVTRYQPNAASHDLWHDRAVFHFLTDPDDRAAYRATLRRALRPGGFSVISTFALDGPERCSGLPVVRYDPEGLQAELGHGLRLVSHDRHLHTTPSGKVQAFTLVTLQREEDVDG